MRTNLRELSEDEQFQWFMRQDAQTKAETFLKLSLPVRDRCTATLTAKDRQRGGLFRKSGWWSLFVDTGGWHEWYWDWWNSLSEEEKLRRKRDEEQWVNADKDSSKPGGCFLIGVAVFWVVVLWGWLSLGG